MRQLARLTAGTGVDSMLLSTRHQRVLKPKRPLYSGGVG